MYEMYQKPLGVFFENNKLINSFLKEDGGRFREDDFKRKTEFYGVDRQQLVNTIKKQYQKSSLTNVEIDKLANENTFTVTTGHQLNLFSGPVFVIYKIIGAINLARKLKNDFPDRDFVPVFWMASEDHDFEEISHATILGKQYEWEPKYLNEGPVGRISTDEIVPLIHTLQDNLNDGEAEREIIALLEKAYKKGVNLADATRILIHELFNNEPLVIIDGDDKELKKYFAPYFIREIETQFILQEVNKANDRLEKEGFHKQVYVRDLNLFYFFQNNRERIDFDEGNYRTQSGSKKWTKDELIKEIKESPEKFSPNALMRPLYQEVILPNVAYIGGAAEISYWQQLPDVFGLAEVPFPKLFVRNSIWWMDARVSHKIKALGFSPEHIWILDKEKLVIDFVQQHEKEIFSLAEQQDKLKIVMEEIGDKVSEIDLSLRSRAEALHKQFLNELQNLEKKVIKLQKERNQAGTNQLLKAKEQLFPESLPQERKENFITFYLKHGKFFFEHLRKHIDVTNKDAQLFIK